MTAYIQTLTDFISGNPHLAVVIVFFVAASEAIAVVGALVPGTAILIGVGAVVGLGHLPLGPILIAATLGAVAGDGLSYWFGHRYKERVAVMWPLSRRPDLLVRGESFFTRYGSMSIVIGRFVPVLRAIIPVVAGMFRMPPLRFYSVNVLSAVIWAPAHILPGAAVGMSFGILGHISSRFAMTLALLAVFAIASAWLLRLALLRLVPLASRSQRAVLARVERMSPGRPRSLLLAVLDPGQDGRTIIPLAALLAIFVISFVSLVEDVVARGELARSDAAISSFVQSLRTAWGDVVMVIITSLGDTVAITAVALVAAAWLAWRRSWRILAGFVVSLVMATSFATLIKAWAGIPRPISIYEGAQVFSFPSGHATMSATLFGILAWFALRGTTSRLRFWAVGLYGALVGMIAISRIYLAAHWPSDVLGGLLFGFGIATIFALVFRRSDLGPVRPGVLAAICVATIAIFGSWHASSTLQKGLDMYAVRSAPVQVLSEADWRGGSWRDLPQARIDLAGESEEPFAVQWAGAPAELASKLHRAGWMTAEVASLSNVGAFFGTSATVSSAMPVLPTMHDGALPLLILAREAGDSRNRQVLRAWSSGTAVSWNGQRMPLLLVSAVTEEIERPFRIASLPETIDDLLRPSALAPIRGTEVIWPDGQPLLLATGGAPGAGLLRRSSEARIPRRL